MERQLRETSGRFLLLILVALSIPLFLFETSHAQIPAIIPLDLPGEEFSPDLEGLTIDSIVIDNRNIYDLSEPRYSKFLFRLANKLHIVTRRKIVRRELLFKEGEPFSSEIARETARNLRTRFPFNDAWITTEILPAGGLLVRVVTIDQWSLLGGLKSIDTDGNETRYQIGVEERNLLGRAQLFEFDYFILSDDENYITSTFRERRLYGRPFRLQFDLSTNPRSETKRILFGRPFYNLSQKFALDIAISDDRSLQERFGATDNGTDEVEEIARWRVKGDRVDLGAEVRWGPLLRKLYLGTSYTYLSQRVIDDTILIPESQQGPHTFQPSDFPEDSAYHRVNITPGYFDRRFIVEQRINGFSYLEDITLGYEASLTAGHAFDPDFKGFVYNYFSLAAGWSQKYGSHLLSSSYSYSVWLHGAADAPFRRTGSFSLRVYNNHFEWVTFAFRTLYRFDKSGDANRIVLGGKSGLRGFETEFRSGDRMHVVNVESRFYTPLELLSVKLGGAVFADAGRTWRRGSATGLDPRDYSYSVGAGLRLSLEKITRDELVRIDLSLTDQGEWDLTVGTGQYF